MQQEMQPRERAQMDAIERLLEHGYCTVETLPEDADYSTDTARRSLRALENGDYCDRTSIKSHTWWIGQGLIDFLKANGYEPPLDSISKRAYKVDAPEHLQELIADYRELKELEDSQDQTPF